MWIDLKLNSSDKVVVLPVVSTYMHSTLSVYFYHVTYTCRVNLYYVIA